MIDSTIDITSKRKTIAYSDVKGGEIDQFLEAILQEDMEVKQLPMPSHILSYHPLMVVLLEENYHVDVGC